MSTRLNNGYTVTRVEGQHGVNGTAAGTFVDHEEKLVVVTDDGCGPDELVDRTARAVDRSWVVADQKAREQARESSIEILHALQFRRVPLIETGEPRLPFFQGPQAPQG